jgi:ADP-ribosylglycohydrolase
MVARALATSGGDVEEFERELGRQLRWWLLTLPPGIGWATLRACLKLLMGFGPKRSGVFSAGNGPAMRSALIGVFAETDAELRSLVRACTRVTHSEPKAEEGAMVVALAAGLAVRSPETTALEFLQTVAGEIRGDELRTHLTAAIVALAEGKSPAEFADSRGWSRGVTGYVNHTVPAAVYCWVHAVGDFRACVENAVLLGGDSDSVAAIAGAICGANLGFEGLPQEWILRLAEWPRTTAWMERLAMSVSETAQGRRDRSPPSMHWLATIPRNLAFAAIVLALGLRRLLPPY